MFVLKQQPKNMFLKARVLQKSSAVLPQKSYSRAHLKFRARSSICSLLTGPRFSQDIAPWNTASDLGNARAAHTNINSTPPPRCAASKGVANLQFPWITPIWETKIYDFLASRRHSLLHKRTPAPCSGAGGVSATRRVRVSYQCGHKFGAHSLSRAIAQLRSARPSLKRADN
jgi:hypothetical protein